MNPTLDKVQNQASRQREISRAIDTSSTISTDRSVVEIVDSKEVCTTRQVVQLRFLIAFTK